jgi:hypothetical protein
MLPQYTFVKTVDMLFVLVCVCSLLSVAIVNYPVSTVWCKDWSNAKLLHRRMKLWPVPIQNFLILKFESYRQSVGLFGRGSARRKASTTYAEQHIQNKRRHSCLELDSNPRSQCFWVGEDILCFIPPGHLIKTSNFSRGKNGLYFHVQTNSPFYLVQEWVAFGQCRWKISFWNFHLATSSIHF